MNNSVSRARNKKKELQQKKCKLKNPLQTEKNNVATLQLKLEGQRGHNEKLTAKWRVTLPLYSNDLSFDFYIYDTDFAFTVED